jgi:endonuclease/exonuclease/phosphatase family metal-dependent hydrolase
LSKHARRRPSSGPVRRAATLALVSAFVVLLTGSATGLAPWSDETSGEDGASDAAPPSTSLGEARMAAAPARERRAKRLAQAVTAELTTMRTMDRTDPRQKIIRSKKPLKRIPKPTYFTFQIGTYNIQGSQHRPNGTGRASTSAGIIMSRGVDVVGLQEVQRDQLAVMRSRMGGYSIWPQEGLGRQGYRHQIAYRTSMFEYVEGSSVTYTFDNQSIPLPYVKLRERSSGGEFWLINTHNSARNLESQRDSATAIQIALINRLKQSGLPVFIVGDVNEHTEWFCKVATATGLVAANGGSGSGGCSLPPGPLRVDWIMGGGGRGVDFSGYVQDGASISSGASDHYFIHGTVTVAAVAPSGNGD